METRRGWSLLVGAAVAGGVHGAFSLYWALGGEFLLDTVGQWALDWSERSPRSAALLLLVVALVKFGGAGAPLLSEAGRLPGPRRAWRALFAVGAVVLICYGAVTMVAAWIGLATGAAPGSGADRAALLGHAFLWDPLFLLWGLLLAVGLRATRLPAGP